MNRTQQTVCAKRFRCAEVLFQPKTYELQTETSSRLAPNASVARKCCSSPRPMSSRRKHYHCWRQTLPLRGSVVPAQDLRAPRRKRHHGWRQTLPLRGSVVPAQDQRALTRKHHCWRRTFLLRGSIAPASFHWYRSSGFHDTSPEQHEV